MSCYSFQKTIRAIKRGTLHDEYVKLADDVKARIFTDGNNKLSLEVTVELKEDIYRVDVNIKEDLLIIEPVNGLGASSDLLYEIRNEHIPRMSFTAVNKKNEVLNIIGIEQEVVESSNLPSTSRKEDDEASADGKQEDGKPKEKSSYNVHVESRF